MLMFRFMLTFMLDMKILSWLLFTLASGRYFFVGILTEFRFCFILPIFSSSMGSLIFLCDFFYFGVEELPFFNRRCNTLSFLTALGSLKFNGVTFALEVVK